MQDDAAVLYQVPAGPAKRSPKLRFRASASGVEKPKSVERNASGYRVSYIGGQIIAGFVSNTAEDIASAGPDNLLDAVIPQAAGNIPEREACQLGSPTPAPATTYGLNTICAGRVEVTPIFDTRL